MNQNDDWNDKYDDDGAQKTDANVDDPALLPSVGSNGNPVKAHKLHNGQ